MFASSGSSAAVTTMTVGDWLLLELTALLLLLISVVRSKGVDFDKERSDFEVLIFLSFFKSSVGDNSRLEDLNRKF